MLRTVIYLRKSSEDETEKQAQSIERQRRDILAFIQKHNEMEGPEMHISYGSKDIIQEDASAKTPGREKFDEMLKNIRAEKYDLLLCTELSRLSRNAIDTGSLTHILDLNCLQYIKTIDKTFTNTPTDKFTFTLFLSVAKYENDQRGKNTSSGMQHKKAQGGTTNKAPMGYMNVGIGVSERFVDKDPESFEKLRELWYLFSLGKHTVSEIHKIAREQGITAIQNYKGTEPLRKIVTEGMFRNMFASPYYCGMIPKGDEYILGGKHPSMVDQDMFDAVQIILQKRGYKHTKKNNQSFHNILKELLICGKTGENMHPDIKTRYNCPRCKYRGYLNQPKDCPECHQHFDPKKWKVNKYRYFISRKAEHTYTWKGEQKSSKSILMEYIEQLVDKQLSKFSIGEKTFEVIKRKLYTDWLAQKTDLDKKRKTIAKKVADIEKEEQEITTAIFTKSPSKEERVQLEEKRESYRTDRVQLEDELKDLQESIDESFDIVWESLHTLLETKNLFGTKDGDFDTSFEPKRNLLISLVSNLKFLDGEIIPEWRFPFSIMASGGGLTNKKSQMKSEISDVSNVWLGM